MLWERFKVILYSKNKDHIKGYMVGNRVNRERRGIIEKWKRNQKLLKNYEKVESKKK